MEEAVSVANVEATVVTEVAGEAETLNVAHHAETRVHHLRKCTRWVLKTSPDKTQTTQVSTSPRA